MKLFFVLAVVTGTLALLAEGAPQILSEELGNAVEQLKEMIQSEIQAVEAKSAYGPRARLSNHPREQSYTRSVSL